MRAHAAVEQQPNFLEDVEAEEVVLGAVFSDPGYMPELEDLQPEDLTGTARPAILRSMRGLARQGQEINHLSVAQWLKNDGQLVRVGGPAALMALDETLKKVSNGSLSPTAKSVAEQVERVLDLSRRRASRAAVRRLYDALLDMNMTAEELLLRAAGDLAAMAGSGTGAVRTATEFLEEEMGRIESIQAGGTDADVQYIPTGLELWDELIGGLPRGVLTVIGAQASVGKSSLIATMALALAEGGLGRAPEKVAVFSLEDRGGWMSRRWLAEASGFAIRQLLKKGLSPEAMADVRMQAEGLGPITDRILIDDRRRLTAHKVAAKMRQLHAQQGVRVFMVDHLLEMLDKSSKANQARDLAVGEILEVLRDVAIELDVAVVVACHLRDPEKPEVDSRFIRPRLQDFAGGQFVNRMARVAVGLWLSPPPRAPNLPKEEVEPKRAAKATDREHAEVLKKWDAKRLQAQAKYAAEYERWRAQCEDAAEALVFSVIKATEGSAHFEFSMRRSLHAGVLHRKGGHRDMAELGFTQARRAA